MNNDEEYIVDKELNEMRAYTNIKVCHIWVIQKKIVGWRKNNSLHRVTGHQKTTFLKSRIRETPNLLTNADIPTIFFCVDKKNIINNDSLFLRLY